MKAREATSQDDVCKGAIRLHTQCLNMISVLVLHGVPGHGVPFVKGAKEVFWEACLGEGSTRGRKYVVEVTNLLIAEANGS